MHTPTAARTSDFVTAHGARCFPGPAPAPGGLAQRQPAAPRAAPVRFLVTRFFVTPPLRTLRHVPLASRAAIPALEDKPACSGRQQPLPRHVAGAASGNG